MKTPYQNLGDTAKVVIRGTFIVMNAFIKKSERPQINNLIMHLKFLARGEQVEPKSSRWKEIIEIRAEINKMEAKRTAQRINGRESWFF
jgi:hypothetical protein